MQESRRENGGNCCSVGVSVDTYGPHIQDVKSEQVLELQWLQLELWCLHDLSSCPKGQYCQDGEWQHGKLQPYIHSCLPSPYSPPCWKERLSCFTFFFLNLGAKLLCFTYVPVRPQGSVYQEIRSAINTYKKAILSVVRTAATCMNVWVGSEVSSWTSEDREDSKEVTGLKGRETSGNKQVFWKTGRSMERKATESMKSSRIVQEGLESWSACYWVSWWARVTTSELAGGKLAGTQRHPDTWQANDAVHILLYFL